MSLRDTIESNAESFGASLAILTVMSNFTGPYCIDTPPNRSDAEQVAGSWREVVCGRVTCFYCGGSGIDPAFDEVCLRCSGNGWEPSDD